MRIYSTKIALGQNGVLNTFIWSILVGILGVLIGIFYVFVGQLGVLVGVFGVLVDIFLYWNLVWCILYFHHKKSICEYIFFG